MQKIERKLIYAQRLEEVHETAELNRLAKQKLKGKFICIEGVDGSGKTTQAKRLVSALRIRGYDAIYTTEPSDGKIGTLIRDFVLSRESRVPIALEALLFAADRVDHVQVDVEPLLNQGKIVVCDRYVCSSLAYQGAAGLDLDWMDCVNRFALKPNLTLFLDVPPEVGLSRLRRKKSVMETAKNLKNVRDVYLNLVQQNRMILLDGNKPVDKVAENVLKVVLKKLKT
jgi:dTMP kinase